MTPSRRVGLPGADPPSDSASASPAPDLSGIDASLSAALERLRSTHLTPAADAAELRDLFAAIEALSLIASGLTRVDVSLASHGSH